jgi:hypothetical protein
MSTLKADTIQSTSGGAATLTKQSAAKAWVGVCDLTDSNSVVDSFNLASVTDDGTGKVDMNLTNAFANAGQSTQLTDAYWGIAQNRLSGQTSSKCRCSIVNESFTPQDAAFCMTANGDLA